MRYFNLGRWADAIELLKQAKDLKPTEGGRRVHLQGMRYTEYLPRYHLGVALFRKHLYEDAYDELLASFLSGQIKKGDKRYKKLTSLKSEAFERRNEEQPAGS
jgi:tetratricopeptide (TPR) repeat protein